MHKKKSEVPEIERLLDEITPDDAFAILNTLAYESSEMAEKIMDIAIDLLSEINYKEVASEVFSVLNDIEVEDVWNRSGKTREGYIDPGEMAYIIFEERLEMFCSEIEKYQALSMWEEASQYCKGVLEGIYRFESMSNSEFLDWGVDVPLEYAWELTENFGREHPIPEHVNKIKTIFKKRFENI